MTNDSQLTYLKLAHRHGTAGPLVANQPLYRDAEDSTHRSEGQPPGRTSIPRFARNDNYRFHDSSARVYTNRPL
jgi:hypothetical protein